MPDLGVRIRHLRGRHEPHRVRRASCVCGGRRPRERPLQGLSRCRIRSCGSGICGAGVTPLQNRVRPDGALVATPERGTLMGNRGGRIHDVETRTLTRRRWTSRAWISCELAYKGWYRTPWTDHYTELFFLDDVTALAAGHRPCYLCRRADAHAFADAIARHEHLSRRPTAPELDRRLHAERLDGRAKRFHDAELGELPDGAMVSREGAVLAVRAGRLLRWSFSGYEDAGPRGNGRVLVPSPPTALAALRGGYRPRWHPSAFAASLQAASVGEALGRIPSA